MADEHHRAAVTERAARAGGVVANSSFRTDVAVETKANPNDLVTTADREAQEQVVATVRQEFPDDTFVLEETPGAISEPGSAAGPPTTAEHVPGTGPVWIVDPIDGTANFVRGIRSWTTSVAAVVDGETVGSATVLPAVGDAYAAGPEGVTRNDEPIAVSDRSDPATFAVAATGGWHRSTSDVFAGLASTVVERFGDLRRLGSFQTTLAHVAAGGLDAAVAPLPTEPWDTVAGVHLIRQAGGTVSDLDGDRWGPDSPGLVASNGHAHDVVLEAARVTRGAE